MVKMFWAHIFGQFLSLWFLNNLISNKHYFLTIFKVFIIIFGTCAVGNLRIKTIQGDLST